MRTIYLVDTDYLVDVLSLFAGEAMFMQRLLNDHTLATVSSRYVTIKDEARMQSIMDGDETVAGTVELIKPFVWKIEMPKCRSLPLIMNV